MRSKKDLEELINYMNSTLKKELDERLTELLKEYAYEEEVKWHYCFPNGIPTKVDLWYVSVCFIKQSNEDDYGFDICFELPESEPFILSSYITRGDGRIVTNDIILSLDDQYEKQSIKKSLDNLIYNYTNLSDLLVKEYILMDKYT